MNMDGFIGVVSDASGPLFSGLLVSVQLTGVSLLIGYGLALLFAVWAMTPGWLSRSLALAVIEIGRGLPLLVLLQFLYFGLPAASITLGPFTAALALQTGAYGSEVFRASIEAVPRSQREAADACGLSRLDAFRYVVLPQAIRIAIPPLMNIGIAIFMATSLAFVVTVPELMSEAYGFGSKTFRYLDVFILAGLFYASVAIPASAGVAAIERKLDPT